MWRRRSEPSEPPGAPLPGDYHTHSTFSGDARSSPDRMCRQALKLGLAQLALTEHAEWQYSQPGFRDPDGYFAEIETCRTRYADRGLTLYAGVELGNPHAFVREAERLLQAYPFDVSVGSLHWLDGENIHDPTLFRRRDAHEVMADYFTEMGRMVQAVEFDIVAHFDRIFWRPALMGLSIDVYAFEAPLRQTLQIIADDGRSLELNTRNVGTRTNWDDKLRLMLTWYREAGGRQVVVNSDAHHANQIQRNFTAALSLLRQAGFEKPSELTPSKAH
jgi:histidinol-phosphatase (PHP family)